MFGLTFKAHGSHCVWSICLECQNKYFLVWTSSSVNKSIVLNCAVLYCILLNCIELNYIVSYCVVLCCVVMYYIICVDRINIVAFKVNLQ